MHQKQLKRVTEQKRTLSSLILRPRQRSWAKDLLRLWLSIQQVITASQSRGECAGETSLTNKSVPVTLPSRTHNPLFLSLPLWARFLSASSSETEERCHGHSIHFLRKFLALSSLDRTLASSLYACGSVATVCYNLSFHLDREASI